MSDVFDDYLARLGLERERPSADALRRLHRAHVERVPYETVWIHVGERYGCTGEESLDRIARTSRGGYCFHLNGAFSELLGALGYDVVRHVGGVHGPDGPSDAEMTNHLVLTVRGLPSEEHRAGDWYVDVGLGDALHEPLPLRAGTYEQPPFALRLTETPGGIGDWHLDHDAGGTFAGMAWRASPCDLLAFEAMHETLSTSPESGFVKYLNVQRRSAGAVDMLRGLLLIRMTAGGREERTLESRDELVSALRDVFGFDLGDFPPGALDALWTKTRAAHVAWVAEVRAT
jgi:N-hydroxyarylamine O-acetyltransferase